MTASADLMQWIKRDLIAMNNVAAQAYRVPPAEDDAVAEDGGAKPVSQEDSE